MGREFGKELGDLTDVGAVLVDSDRDHKFFYTPPHVGADGPSDDNLRTIPLSMGVEEKARIIGDDGRLDAVGVELVDEKFGVRLSQGRVGNVSTDSRALGMLGVLAREPVGNGGTLKGRGKGSG